MDNRNQNLHVITENGEQCFMWRSNQLTYIAQEREELPLVLATKFGPLATKLDLSYNTLTSYDNINLFTNLSELILDNNSLEDENLDFRQNLRLKTLSMNKNRLTNLSRLIRAIRIAFPNLEFLSLLGNPLCPTQLVSSQMDPGGAPNPLAGSSSNETDLAYQKYRHFIIYHLPNLRFLDSAKISCQERDEALKRCQWMYGPNASACRNIESNGTSSTTEDTNRRVLYDDRYGFQMTSPSERQQLRDHNGQLKGSYTRLVYNYTGRNSEGNRFIKNHDL